MGNRAQIGLFGLLILLLGCQPEVISTATEAQLPTIAPTSAPPDPTNTTAPLELIQTNTPQPTDTVEPTAPPTETPTPTLTPEPTETIPPTFTPIPSPTVTLTPEPTAVSRDCPNPAPLKPDYERYVLSPAFWPEPDLANRTAHFWLSKPLPGGGRLLFNKTYPYGFDGDGRYLLHNGVDSAEALGTPVLAVADGTVVVAQSDANALFGWRCDWYGHLVVVELDETWQGQPMFALYGHVLNINVEVGQRVSRGEPLAEVGFGGAAIVPHLHFELRVGENNFASTRNPMLWISPGTTRGVIAGRLTDPQGRPWQGVVVSLVGPDGAADFINTYTYLDDPRNLINPDETYAENFVFADVVPGQYIVVVTLSNKEYRATVDVTAGELSFADIVTEPIGE
ncbi:MAG: peptidoglycan DD-metalloendopeptidase family protein [Chloroflexota bacterium]